MAKADAVVVPGGFLASCCGVDPAAAAPRQDHPELPEPSEETLEALRTKALRPPERENSEGMTTDHELTTMKN